MSKIRFLKYKVVNDELGTSAKVWYSTEFNGSPVKYINVYATDYGHQLSKVLPGEDIRNETDITTDYFDNDALKLVEGHPLYAAARKAHEDYTNAYLARQEKKKNKNK